MRLFRCLRHISRTANRLGALALALGDEIKEATEAATGMAGGLPAALVSLREWADGSSVDVLAEAMRVSHSRAVRIVDRFEAAGLARRESDPSDGRRALVRLEPAGRELAERALDARARVLLSAVAGLGARDVGALERLLGALLGATTVDVRAARMSCRLCDARACGHYGGACPSAGRPIDGARPRDPRSRRNASARGCGARACRRADVRQPERRRPQQHDPGGRVRGDGVRGSTSSWASLLRPQGLLPARPTLTTP